MITESEKIQLAQHKFNSCFKEWGYNICGIAEFYEEVLWLKDFYKIKNEMAGYETLRAFHTFNPIEESTKVKLIELTKSCFKQMGYDVDESLISWKK